MNIKDSLRHIGLARNYVKYDGSVIPSPDKRWCGNEFHDDKYYIESADMEAYRLINNFGCNNKSKILDIGCGQGRLAIGLNRIIGELEYIGLDVDEWSIRWCQKHIQSHNPCYTFYRINVYNERYNRKTSMKPDDFHFDYEDSSIDIVYLYSVFSHMEDLDMRAYLSEIYRMLKDGGSLFFTTFIEDDVEDFTINPLGYIFQKNMGSLHVVRYRTDYILSILRDHGFDVIKYSHGTEADKQSAIYAKKHGLAHALTNP